MVGKPYTVRGKTYVPADQPDYVATGIASWYGADFHGRRTANGEIFSANAISGAHPTLPLPSYVRVTNLSNGRSMLVRLNDRGPYVNGRVIDLSYKAAETLGLIGQGTGEVQVEYVGPAPLNGDDTRMLMASLNQETRLEKQMDRSFDTGFPTGESDVRVADTGTPVNPAARCGRRHGRRHRRSLQLRRGPAGRHRHGHRLRLRRRQRHGDALAGARRLGRCRRRGLPRHPPRARRSSPTRRSSIASSSPSPRSAPSTRPKSRCREGPATRLTLSKLKPGVARADVLTLARELGLTGLVLY